MVRLLLPLLFVAGFLVLPIVVLSPELNQWCISKMFLPFPVFLSMDITSLDELEDQLDPQMFFAATDNTSSTSMAVPPSSP
jgi:hypothetical protein